MPASDLPEYQASKLTILQKLPAELIEHICRVVAETSVKDVRKLRLVCRAFDKIASGYGLPEVAVYLHESDFLALHTIAAQPNLRPHVRSFTYIPDMIEKPGTLQEMYEDYRKQRRADARDALTRTARKKILGRPVLDRRQLHTHWTRSKSLYSMQQNLLENEDDLELFQDILPLFPNIRELAVLSNQLGSLASPLDGRRRKNSPFNNGLADYFWKPLDPEGVRAMNALLDALPAGSKIKTLRAGALNWRFWDPANQSLHKLMGIAANLTCICLQIETGYNDERDEHGTEVTACKATLQHGGKMREFLRRAPNLEQLYIDFEDIHDTDGFGAHFHDVIGPQQHWPRLHTIDLGGVECERADLEAFMGRHGAVLESVSLHSISLGRTSWVKFLTEMRRVTNLAAGIVSGELTGEDEDTGHAEYWDILEPAHQRTDIMEDISAYLVCKMDHHPHPLVTHPNMAHELI